jgi:hypothetical protein
MSTAFRAIALFLIAACGRVSLPRPTASDSQTLAGDWTLEFQFDSLRSAGAWSPASQQATQGTLHLDDSDGVTHSSIQVDFKTLLGREMSCFDPRPTSTVISHSGESTSLHFTPGAADCGLTAFGKFYGDSLVGTWEETSFIGPVALGRFRMIRK